MALNQSKIKTEITFPIGFNVSDGMMMIKHGKWGGYVWYIVKETERFINYEKYPCERQYDPYGQIRKGYERIRCYIKPFSPLC